MVLDSKTFYNNSLSTLPTTAIDEVQLYYKNVPVLKYMYSVLPFRYSGHFSWYKYMYPIIFRSDIVANRI